ncbi:hypothetical protein QR680_003596 [Steinernema hermaphroditum]|uniref:Uncharacterized protein n=1 Tax=Steinernema hermaphroditum TaxID=289476 RepID=A0AA39HN79_9BILA|nr:hypothetical protein QR680_003596 [Steinernema hermaphroditum]
MPLLPRILHVNGGDPNASQQRVAKSFAFMMLMGTMIVTARFGLIITEGMAAADLKYYWKRLDSDDVLVQAFEDTLMLWTHQNGSVEAFCADLKKLEARYVEKNDEKPPYTSASTSGAIYSDYHSYIPHNIAHCFAYSRTNFVLLYSIMCPSFVFLLVAVVDICRCVIKQRLAPNSHYV